MHKSSRLEYLKQRLKYYEDKYAKKLKENGQLVRTRYGEGFSDQLYLEQKVLEDMILSIKLEIQKIKEDDPKSKI